MEVKKEARAKKRNILQIHPFATVAVPKGATERTFTGRLVTYEGGMAPKRTNEKNDRRADQFLSTPC